MSPFAGCVISLAIGGLAVACLVLLLQLTLRGDVFLGRGTPNETRIWLIREDANQGIGLSRSRTRDSVRASAQCVQTDIRFFLWLSDGDYPPLTTCSCLSEQGEAQLTGPCPP